CCLVFQLQYTLRLIFAPTSMLFPIALHKLLFLYHCFGAPLSLLSFPTRRSSDLPRLWKTLWITRGAEWRNALSGAMQGAMHQLRSEEHTSELQSRFDLVCRLLLEKKNKRYNVNVMFISMI